MSLILMTILAKLWFSLGGLTTDRRAPGHEGEHDPLARVGIGDRFGFGAAGRL
jgi:hypothetical protein